MKISVKHAQETALKFEEGNIIRHRKTGRVFILNEARPFGRFRFYQLDITGGRITDSGQSDAQFTEGDYELFEGTVTLQNTKK